MKRMLLQSEQGSTVVEFAVIATVLFTIVFGIIEFSLVVFDQHILTNASREGARAGIVMRAPRLPDRAVVTSDPPCYLDAYELLPDGTCVPAGVIDIVERYSEEHMVSFQPSIAPVTTVTRPWLSLVPPTPRFGDELTVRVTYQYHFMFLSGIGLGPITLQAETRMRIE